MHCASAPSATPSHAGPGGISAVLTELPQESTEQPDASPGKTWNVAGYLHPVTGIQRGATRLSRARQKPDMCMDFYYVQWDV